MNDFAIVIFSCDKNEDVYPICLKLLNKYYPDHPRVYALSETKKYESDVAITCDMPLEKWSKRIRLALEKIHQNKIIFMCDDVFLKAPINKDKLYKALDMIKNNVANVNFERSFEETDQASEYEGFKFRPPGAYCRVSLLCGLWDRKKLIDVLSEDCSPWDIEIRNKDYGYDYYICSDQPIFEWLNDRMYGNGSVRDGKWQKEVKEFLENENIEVDYNKRGFYVWE